MVIIIIYNEPIFLSTFANFVVLFETVDKVLDILISQLVLLRLLTAAATSNVLNAMTLKCILKIQKL